MDISVKPKGGVGFWTGVKLGLGFMTGVAAFCAAGVGVLFVVAWLAFGSMRDMAVATVGGFGSVAGSAAHAVVSETKEGALRLKDHVVDGAASTAQRIGGTAKDAGVAIKDKAAGVGERASDAGGALRDRAGALVGRIGWPKSRDDKVSEPNPKPDQPQETPTPSTP